MAFDAERNDAILSSAKKIARDAFDIDEHTEFDEKQIALLLIDTDFDELSEFEIRIAKMQFYSTIHKLKNGPNYYQKRMADRIKKGEWC